MGLAQPAPVRLQVDEPLEKVEHVEEALHDLGLGGAETSHRQVHPLREVAEGAVGLLAALVLHSPVNVGPDE